MNVENTKNKKRKNKKGERNKTLGRPIHHAWVCNTCYGVTRVVPLQRCYNIKL
jgi:hypothetical protein